MHEYRDFSYDATFPLQRAGLMIGAPKQVLSLLATHSEADSDMISVSLVGSSAAGRLQHPTIYKDVSN